jgi:hypothetical protein
MLSLPKNATSLLATPCKVAPRILIGRNKKCSNETLPIRTSKTRSRNRYPSQVVIALSYAMQIYTKHDPRHHIYRTLLISKPVPNRNQKTRHPHSSVPTSSAEDANRGSTANTEHVPCKWLLIGCALTALWTSDHKFEKPRLVLMAAFEEITASRKFIAIPKVPCIMHLNLDKQHPKPRTFLPLRKRNFTLGRCSALFLGPRTRHS